MRTRAMAFLLILVAGGASADEGGAAKVGRRATVHHLPPAEAADGEPLRLVAAVDDAWTEAAIWVRYRTAGAGGEYERAQLERSSAGGYHATIPAEDVHRPGVEYYIEGSFAEGGLIDHFASAAAPHEVRVEPAADALWTEAERRRLDGRMARVRTRLAAMSFGSANGDDTLVRGEVDWTYRLVATLYSFSLGFGFIHGVTPDLRGQDPPPSLHNGARYGFGEVRWRLHSSVWVDTGVLLGFSQDGFAAGVRGQLILGRDWRTCVQIGGEYLGGVGPSGWVRLQWDTVPPFLMGAEVRATNLPGATLDGGVVLTYDITYPVTRRINVGVQLGYASRPRSPGSLEGGLTTAWEF